MSERVRMAMALDAVEESVGLCEEHARAKVCEADRFQNTLCFDISGMVERASVVYGVPRADLMREALAMLRNGLCGALYGRCDVRYVRPYEVGGVVVGMEARFYVRRTA